MNAQQANEIEVLLEGIPLPAKRRDLVAYAAAQDREAAAILEQRLPDEEFDRLDKVGELLLGHRSPPAAPAKPPMPESGKPPGGDDYLRPFPEPGAVRPSGPADNPSQKVLEEQTKTQEQQKAKQDAG